MSDKQLNIAEENVGDICIVALAGRIDSGNAGELGDALNRLIEGGRNRLLLDLAQLAYLTSAGFRVLLIVSDSVEESGGSLALCNVEDDVRELFEMGGLLDIFVIHTSRDKALAGL